MYASMCTCAQEEELHRSAVDIYTRLLDSPTTKMPDLLLQVSQRAMRQPGAGIAWCMHAGIVCTDLQVGLCEHMHLR